MAIQKYCPLKFSSTELSSSDTYYCSKEYCAWWDRLAGDCAITVIAKLGLEGSFNAITKEIKR